MEKKDIFCVIMAGGIGSRFWPMSRTKYPKQFLDVLGVGKSLLQQTYDRLLNLCPPENILVVTNEEYGPLVAEQLPDLPSNNILNEPARRNTAPCIAYASFKVKKRNPNAVVVVAPSDHLILNEDDFVQSALTAANFAVSENALVTLGIQPSRPDTGYGYIQYETGKSEVKKVKTFTEKPDHDIAVKFLESGDFLWNSGIFIWSVKSAMFAFQKHLNEMYRAFESGEDAYDTDAENEFIHRVYPECKNISVDYGIMEKASNVFVIPSDWGWSDLGTWGSLYTHLEKDKNKNAVLGKNVMLLDSKNNIINNNSSRKLIVVQGLEDYIVVDKSNVLLICKKEDEQEIKQIVNNVKLEKGDEYV
jgi:mannose-1-phosphate guanylyltransferase